MPVDIGTKTPKHFRMAQAPRSLGMQPTGVWDYHRIDLDLLFPQLRGVSLYTYYRLRIACCGHLVVTGEDTIRNCDVCDHNKGFVCPYCLGARHLDDEMTRRPCPLCTVPTIRDKIQVNVYDEEAELRACQAWFAHNLPFGVPTEPTPQDLLRMDCSSLRG